MHLLSDLFGESLLDSAMVSTLRIDICLWEGNTH